MDNKLQDFAVRYKNRAVDSVNKKPAEAMPDGEIAAHVWRVTGKLYPTSYIRQMRQGHHPISEAVALRLQLVEIDFAKES